MVQEGDIKPYMISLPCSKSPYLFGGKLMFELVGARHTNTSPLFQLDVWGFLVQELLQQISACAAQMRLITPVSLGDSAAQEHEVIWLLLSRVTACRCYRVMKCSICIETEGCIYDGKCGKVPIDSTFTSKLYILLSHAALGNTTQKYNYILNYHEMFL